MARRAPTMSVPRIIHFYESLLCHNLYKRYAFRHIHNYHFFINSQDPPVYLKGAAVAKVYCCRQFHFYLQLIYFITGKSDSMLRNINHLKHTIQQS